MGCTTSKTLHVSTDIKEALKVKEVHIEEDGDRRLKSWGEEPIEKQDGDRDVNLTRIEKKASSEAPKQQHKAFAIGDRVHVRGYVGIVKFVGLTELGEGEWIGIEMNQELEQGNDGSYEGIQYFLCGRKTRCFC